MQNMYVDHISPMFGKHIIDIHWGVKIEGGLEFRLEYI